MKALVVALACVPVIAAADDHVTVEADALALLFWGEPTGGSLGYEHRFDPLSGVTVRTRASRGVTIDSEPARFELFTALAGYRIHTLNEGDLTGFAGVELGWQGVRTERATGDFGAHYPLSWDNHVDAELSLGVNMMKYVTAELRLQVPVWGIGASFGVTL